MPDKYYYLIASLPYLNFNDKMPITEEEFLSECEKWLSEEDFMTIKRVSISDFKINTKDSPVLKKWKEFDFDLRERAAQARKMFLAEAHEKLPPRVKEIFREKNPLEIEKLYELRRWDFIEEAEFGHYFDIGILILYYLKLQILGRLETFDKEKGKVVFEKLCEADTDLRGL